MADIIFASVPVHGHVSPLLPLARRFVERGDRVRFLTGARFAAAVTATGAEHIPLPADADFDDRNVAALFPEREKLPAVKAIAFDFEHIFVRPGEHQLAALTSLIADARADAVVCDPLFLGSAFFLQLPLEQRAPVVVAGLVPLNIPGPDLAPFGMGLPPLPGIPGRLRNAVLRSMTRRLFAPVDAAAQEIARRITGRALPGPVLEWLPRADAIVQLSVPGFEYPRSAMPDRLVFTGPVTVSPTDQHVCPPWWTDLDGSRPVVHVTQGTVANHDLRELVLPTLQALAHEDVLVVVATGGAPVDALSPLPANARVAEFLPYDELFERTDVFVTNGGYGGTQFALRHGVPIVVAPGKEDKVEVAARIAWSGAGVNLRTQHPSPEKLRTAVRRVLADRGHRDAAGRLATEIAASSGAAGFLAATDDAIARHAALIRPRA